MNLAQVYSSVRGDLEVFLRTAEGDRTLFRTQNMIVNSGSDILAKCLGGIDRAINGMYLQFDNGADLVDAGEALSVDREASFYHSTTNLKGILRVATLASPSFETTVEADYQHNKVLFVAVSDDNVLTGEPIVDGTSRFFGAGLIHRAETYADDVLFSAVHFRNPTTSALTPITKIANAQIGVRWGITFTTPTP